MMINQTDFKSKFNIAGFKTRLIANLLFSSSYNFRLNKVQAWYADLRALKVQIISKLNQDERDVLSGYESLINQYMKYITDPSTQTEYSKAADMNHKVIATVKPIISQYETKIMEIFDKLKLDLPEADTDSLWEE